MELTESISSIRGISQTGGSSTEECSRRVCSAWMRILRSRAINASGLDEKLTCNANATPGLPYIPVMALISYML